MATGYQFSNCPNLTTLKVMGMSNIAFGFVKSNSNNSNLSLIDFSGADTFNDEIFANVAEEEQPIWHGKTFTLIIKAALEFDAQIVAIQAVNTVTLILV